jgi:hypothetical protein
MLKIEELNLPHLREAIQNNIVSFPSQVPVFPRQSRADIQWRLAELYLIRNWTCFGLAKRYDLTEERIRQLISHWVRRAVVLGYLQEIPPAGLPIPLRRAADQPEIRSPRVHLSGSTIYPAAAASSS